MTNAYTVPVRDGRFKTPLEMAVFRHWHIDLTQLDPTARAAKLEELRKPEEVDTRFAEYLDNAKGLLYDAERVTPPEAEQKAVEYNAEIERRKLESKFEQIDATARLDAMLSKLEAWRPSVACLQFKHELQKFTLESIADKYEPDYGPPQTGVDWVRMHIELARNSIKFHEERLREHKMQVEMHNRFRQELIDDLLALEKESENEKSQ